MDDEQKLIEFARIYAEKHNEPHVVDMNGSTWLKYECVFKHDNKEYCFELWGKNFDDADARLKSIKETASISGQIVNEGNL